MSCSNSPRGACRVCSTTRHLVLIASPTALGLAVALSVMVLSGCSRKSRSNDWARVASGIEERTGYRIAASATPGEPSIPEGVSTEDGVTQDEAIALALWNNAAFLETLADLGIARAELIKAGLLQNPVFSLLFPTGPRQWESSLAFSLDAVVLRPKRIAIAQIQSRRVGQRLVQNGLDLVRDVRVAHADLALAQDRAKIGEETDKLLERIADLSEKRLRAGDVSEFEVAMARIDAITARSNTTLLARDVALAQERLRALIGYGYADSVPTFGAPPDETPLGQEVRTLVEEALAARPDFRAAELASEAAAEQAGLARWEWLKLDILLDGDEIDSEFEVGPGFRIPLPIFNRNQDGIARAKAEFERSMRRQITIRDQIMLEVKQSHTRYLQARENLETLRTRILSQLEEAVARAEKAYGNGSVSYLLVLETARQLLNARGREAEAVAALRRARAELERSVGRKLDYEPVQKEPDLE